MASGGSQGLLALCRSSVAQAGGALHSVALAACQKAPVELRFSHEFMIKGSIFAERNDDERQERRGVCLSWVDSERSGGHR